MTFIILVIKHLMLHWLVNQHLIILMMVDLIFCKTQPTSISANHLRSIAQGLNLGLGAEFRYEKYKIYSGEELSYKILIIPTGS